MSNSNINNKRGVDSLLTAQGKSLQTGQSISFRLVKGPGTRVSADPVDPKAPHEVFPLVAKFPESVVKPVFTTAPWKDGRLYQQNVPKPAEDSDEEGADANKQPKKKWRHNRDNAPQRQWILQEQVDFLETMVARREKKPINTKKLSSRYEGVPEHNSSHYVMFQLNDDDDIQVSLLPLNSTVTFAQPAARKTLSLSQAEQVIQDQRMGIRTMHNHGTDEDAIKQPATLRLPTANKNTSKNRILNKLKAKHDDDDDDIMGDVAFRNRKGSAGAARKELLGTLADGINVSDDGVLGGTDDTVFGGKQRFGQFKGEQQQQRNKQAQQDNTNQQEERGADGAAMADDFYQRDVQAEYEELDYDANDQFDDDDVDLGEAEVVVDKGFGDEDDEEELDDLDLEEEAVSGVEGLATVAGFKAMLAKARGEVAAQPMTDGAEGVTPGGAEKNAKEEAKRPSTPGQDEGDHIAKIMAAAEKSAQAAKEKVAQQQAAGKKPAAAAAIQLDENGFRIITVDAVRREIWLNHGSIPMKRLMKIFDVKKKSSADRQNKFRDVVKELCTMKTDPVGGRMLVLKQHYANMS